MERPDWIDDAVLNVQDVVDGGTPGDVAIEQAILSAMPRDEEPAYGSWLFCCSFCKTTWTREPIGNEYAAPNSSCPSCDMLTKAGF
jgi:hypothetical protein